MRESCDIFGYGRRSTEIVSIHGRIKKLSTLLYYAVFKKSQGENNIPAEIVFQMFNENFVLPTLD